MRINSEGVAEHSPGLAVLHPCHFAGVPEGVLRRLCDLRPPLRRKQADRGFTERLLRRVAKHGLERPAHEANYPTAVNYRNDVGGVLDETAKIGFAALQLWSASAFAMALVRILAIA